jgi:hypothetical protein
MPSYFLCFATPFRFLSRPAFSQQQRPLPISKMGALVLRRWHNWQQLCHLQSD